MYSFRQGIIRLSDVSVALRKAGHAADVEHFFLPRNQFKSRFGESPLAVLTELRLPIWFILRSSNRKKADWVVASPKGERVHIPTEEIFSTATLAHGTHKFHRWAVINTVGDSHIPEITGNCPLTGTRFELLTRMQFAVLLQPKAAYIKPSGLLKNRSELGPLVFNAPHFNENHGKFIKSKYGMGYVVSPSETPDYNFSHRLNAVSHGFFSGYPHSEQYYIPLRAFEPYAVPTGSIAPQTLHILNWCATGCDDLIRRSL